MVREFCPDIHGQVPRLDVDGHRRPVRPLAIRKQPITASIPRTLNLQTLDPKTAQSGVGLDVGDVPDTGEASDLAFC